jgi:hypothetical protein
MTNYPYRKQPKQEKSNNNTDNSYASTWWGKLLAGLALIVMTFIEYSRLGKLETGEIDSLRVTNIEYWLYNHGGKMTICGVFLFFGIGLTLWGIKQLQTGSE